MADPVDWPTRDLVAHRRDATPERTALVDVDEGARYTYRQLDREVDRLARALARAIESAPPRGTDDASRMPDGATTRVATLVGTRPAFVALFFATMRTGTTLVPLNVEETPAELESKLDRTDPSLLVCDRETESLALESWDGPVRSIDEPADAGVESLRRGTSTVEDDRVDPVPLDRTDVQLVMFTSGTSGDPKGVRITVGNLVSSATASAFRLGVLPDDRWLCCLPTYHMGGLAPVVRSAVYGTTVVLQRSFEPEATAKVLEEHEITGVSLVPTTLKRLLDSGWTPPNSLRFVLLGGAPASTKLLERCFETGVPVHPTYGMTEAASQIATATPEEARTYEGTVGRPLGFTDVTVLDERGRPLETNEPGELVVSGPTITPGYLDSAHTEEAFCEFGLRTGDMGYRDSGGRLWVVGRTIDRIVTGGENVDPEEVIEVLESHPGIDAAAVVGLPDEEWGERVAALLVPRNPADRPPSGAIRDHCEGRLASFKRPKTVAYVDALPRTPSGTVDRDAVRRFLLDADEAG